MNSPASMVTPTNAALSLVAWLATAVGVALLLATNTGRLATLIQLAGISGAVIQLGAIVLGSAGLVGATMGPLLIAAVVAASAAEGQPAWTMIVVGVLWFIGAELAWEAIDRRDGIARAPSATRLRVRDVATVSLLAVGVGLVAVVGSGSPPARSLPLQILVALIFFTAGLAVARRLQADRRRPSS